MRKMKFAEACQIPYGSDVYVETQYRSFGIRRKESSSARGVCRFRVGEVRQSLKDGVSQEQRNKGRYLEHRVESE